MMVPVAGFGPRAEQRLEKIAVGRIAGTRAAEFKTSAPIRRRPKILSGGMPLSQLIVGGALLRALEQLVGLADFLAARLGILFLADVRVIFAGELAVRLLDLRLGGVARHTHDLVIVLKFHGTCQDNAASVQGYYASL